MTEGWFSRHPPYSRSACCSPPAPSAPGRCAPREPRSPSPR